MNKPAYTYTLDRKKKLLCIKDLFDEKTPTPSVTNKAEEVLEEIGAKESIVWDYDWYIMYYDTNNRLDMMYQSYTDDELCVTFGPMVPLGWRWKALTKPPKILYKELIGKTLQQAQKMIPQCEIKVCNDQIPWDWEYNRVKVLTEENKITKVIGFS